MAHATGLPAAEQSFLTNCWAGLMERDPEAAVKLLSEKDNLPEWWNTAGSARSGFAGPSQARKLVDAAPAQLRAGLASLYRDSLIEGDIEHYLSIAGTAKTAAGEGSDALLSIPQLASWLHRDPQKAIAWLDEGKLAKLNWEQLASEWVGRDPEAASQYINKMPAGPQRQAATAGLVETVVWQDPDMARAWFATIPEEAQKSFFSKSVTNFLADPASPP
jgi:hypothetical protein